MSSLKISYLITTKNETDTLIRLLEKLVNNRFEGDEIVILDDFSDNETTKKLLADISKLKDVVVCQHTLNGDYGAHKNYGTEKCSGDFIFQIDADELPSDILIFNIRDIIETNKTIELIYVPRINDFKGVTEQNAKRWGWKLTPSTTIVHEKIIDSESYEYKFLKNNGYILEETYL